MWGIAIARVERRGSLEQRTLPTVRWELATRYGRHRRSVDAKRAYVVALEPERAAHSDDWIARQFAAWRRWPGDVRTVRIK